MRYMRIMSMSRDDADGKVPYIVLSPSKRTIVDMITQEQDVMDGTTYVGDQERKRYRRGVKIQS